MNCKLEVKEAKGEDGVAEVGDQDSGGGGGGSVIAAGAGVDGVPIPVAVEIWDGVGGERLL